jgi:hypothetical protein
LKKFDKKGSAMKKIFDTLAFLLIIIAFYPYIKAVWKDRNIPAGTPGKTEPSKTSWIIWAALDIITAYGMYVKGSINGQISAAVIGGCTVAVLAMKFGTSNWTKLDKGCLGGAVLGIVLWKVFGDATPGIVTCQIVLFVGSIPTFVSVWKDPGRENKVAWIIFWLSCVSALIAIPGLTLDVMLNEPTQFFLAHLNHTAQPVTFFIIETIVTSTLFIRPLFVRGKKNNF